MDSLSEFMFLRALLKMSSICNLCSATILEKFVETISIDAPRLPPRTRSVSPNWAQSFRQTLEQMDISRENDFRLEDESIHLDPNLNLERLDHPQFFESLITRWTDMMKLRLPSAGLYHRQGYEMAAKIQFACGSQYTLKDLWAQRRIRDFVMLHGVYILHAKAPAHDWECLCENSYWNLNGDPRALTREGFLRKVAMCAEHYLTPQIAECLGDVRISSSLHRMVLPAVSQSSEPGLFESQAQGVERGASQQRALRHSSGSSWLSTDPEEIVPLPGTSELFQYQRPNGIFRSEPLRTDQSLLNEYSCWPKDTLEYDLLRVLPALCRAFGDAWFEPEPQRKMKELQNSGREESVRDWLELQVQSYNERE